MPQMWLVIIMSPEKPTVSNQSLMKCVYFRIMKAQFVKKPTILAKTLDLQTFAFERTSRKTWRTVFLIKKFSVSNLTDYYQKKLYVNKDNEYIIDHWKVHFKKLLCLKLKNSWQFHWFSGNAQWIFIYLSFLWPQKLIKYYKSYSENLLITFLGVWWHIIALKIIWISTSSNKW